MKRLITCLTVFLFSYSFNAVHAQDASAVVSKYLSVKNALVTGNAATAAAQAGELQKAIAATDAKAFPAGLQATLSGGAKAIADSKDVSKQRTAFGDLSVNMIQFVKTIKPGSGTLYVDYCPMKKLSWLSEEEEIKNPYYGNAMLSCGNVTETIKP
ncbi:DUF3347 domain-containing protein [Foetidibacter luteolus]|uniref:DUF3347 domain-containing protein n=1 Tax=Foetidibacter luteolus TaxID=2608880 RepID=UPI00129B6BC6|nr:DUF3347 domain-containing protein [Foetidibacter luteolus]